MDEPSSDKKLMKDALDADAVKRITQALSKASANFPVEAFTQSALDGIDNLELKDRVNHFISALHQAFPYDFEKTADILFAMKEHWDPGDPNDALRGFPAWPLIDYVSVHGLDHMDLSLDLLRHLTPLFTAEFAIRHFILKDFSQVNKHLTKWVTDDSEHVRRLASEGTRTRLPWGLRLQPFCVDPTPVLPILEALKADSSDYVRRSVANNLNDISKDHPELVIKTGTAWLKDNNPDTAWIVRHATRGLIKQGHPKAFALQGFTAQPKLNITEFKLAKKKIKLGQDQQLELIIESKSSKSQKLAIDYAIHHMKANGQLSPKVFKWKVTDLKPKGRLSLSKKHPIKAITTRRYYPGIHKAELLINGKSLGLLEFDLEL